MPGHPSIHGNESPFPGQWKNKTEAPVAATRARSYQSVGAWLDSRGRLISTRIKSKYQTPKPIDCSRRYVQSCRAARACPPGPMIPAAAAAGLMLWQDRRRNFDRKHAIQSERRGHVAAWRTSERLWKRRRFHRQSQRTLVSQWPHHLFRRSGIPATRYLPYIGHISYTASYNNQD